MVVVDTSVYGKDVPKPSAPRATRRLPERIARQLQQFTTSSANTTLPAIERGMEDTDKNRVWLREYALALSHRKDSSETDLRAAIDSVDAALPVSARPE